MNEQLAILSNDTLPVPMAKNESIGLSGTTAIKSNELALRNTVKVAVLRSFKSLGKKSEVKDLTFIVDGLKEEILRSFPGIRLEEIGLAIHKLSMGELIPIDKIFNLSLSIFVTGIRMYMASDSRAQAAKQYFGTLLLETRTKPTEEEMAKVAKQNTLNAYEFFKVHGDYNDYGNTIFDNLVNYGGIINFTEEQRIEIWKQARRNIFKALTMPARNMDERSVNKLKLEEVKKDKDHPLFYTEAKKIGLNMIFKDLLAMELDLNDMITND